MAWALLGGVLAYALISRVPPSYTARASVMLEARNVRALESGEVLSDANLNNALLESEAAVLSSNTLLEQVISEFPAERLAEFDPANQPPGMRARLSTWVKDRSTVIFGPAPVDASAGIAPEDDLTMTPEELRVRRLVRQLRDGLRVWREGNSYVIAVVVETTDPELSMLFANAIVSKYIENQISERTQAVRDVTLFLGDRVETMQAAVETAEAAVVQFQTDQLQAVGATPDLMSRQLIELGARLATARADLAAAEARYTQIQTVVDAGGLEGAAEVLSSPIVVSFLQQRAGLERQDTELSTTRGEDHPERREVRAAIDRLNQTIDDEIRKIVASLKIEVDVARSRVASLDASVAEIETKVAEISKDSLTLRQLEREAEGARTSYEAALARLNSTRSTESLQRAYSRLVDQATLPGGPSAPRVLLFTVFGATAGLSAGLLLAFVRTLTRPGFMTSNQIERTTGLSVLASLPRVRAQGARAIVMLVKYAPYKIFAERVRQLHAAIRLRPNRETPKIILVTSSVSGEGKTSTALALAYIEGLSTRSCIVVDLDLRRSTMSREMEYNPPKCDLSDCLSYGQPLDDAIFHSEKYGFSILTSKKPDPRLVDETPRSEIRDMLNELAKRYDTVIIDAPPLVPVADAMQLAQFADFTLLAVKQGATHRDAVSRSIHALEDVGVAGEIGIVFTNVDRRDERAVYGSQITYSARYR